MGAGEKYVYAVYTCHEGTYIHLTPKPGTRFPVVLEFTCKKM